MRQLLVVALGCLPLIWLTASNLSGWHRTVEVAAPADASPKLDLASIDLRSVELSQTASDQIPFVQSLVPLEPFGDSLPEIQFTKLEPFKALTTSWQDYTHAHAAVLRLAQIYPGEGWPDPASETKNLGAYLAANPLEKLPGGKTIEKWCQHRREVLARAHTTEAALETVRSDFSSGNYDAARKHLKQLPKELLSEAEKLEMKGIQRKSDFELYWKDFPVTPAPTVLAEARRRATKLEEHLKKSPSLLDEHDHVDPGRKAVIDRHKKELSDLQCQIKVDELFENPPDQFADLARECHRILAGEPRTQPRLHESLRKWIDERLPARKPPTYDRDEREAWQTDGTYRRGVFRECKDFNSLPKSAQYYKYWKLPATFRNGKPFNNEVYLKDLRAEPGEMLEIRLCRVYEEKRVEILKAFDSKRKSDDFRLKWKEFASSCEEMQNQLTEYYSKVKLEKQEVSFKDEAQLAGEIVKEWAKVELILKPTR